MADFVKTFRLVLDADARGAITGLDNLGKAAKKAETAGGASLDKLSSGLTKVGVGAVAASVAGGGALLKLATNFEKLALSANKMALATGLSTEEASRFIEVASDMGVETIALTQGLGKLNKAAETTPATFEAIGAEIVRTNDGAVDVNATFLKTVDALNAIEDPAKRQVAAAALLGKSWQGLAELVGEGSDKLKASLAAVAGAKVIDDDKVAKAKEFRASIDALTDSVGEFGLAIGEGAAPLISKFASGLSSVVNLIGKTDAVTGGAAGSLLAFGTAALGIAGTLSIVAGQAIKMRDRFTDAEGALNNFGRAAKGAAIGLGVLAGAVAAVEILEFVNRITADSAGAEDALNQLTISLAAAEKQQGPEKSRQTIEGLVKATKELDKSRGILDKFLDVITAGPNDDQRPEKIALKLTRLKETIEETLAVDPSQRQDIVDALEGMKAAADGGDQATRKYLNSLGLTNDEIDKEVKHLNLATEAQKVLSGATDAGADASDVLTAALDNQASAIAKVEKLKGDAQAVLWAKSMEAATTASDFLTKSLERQQDALLGIQKAREDSHDLALASQAADLDAADAIGKYNESLVGRGVDTKDVSAATKDLAEAQEKYNKSLEVTPSSDLDIRSAQLDLADAQAKAKAVRNDYHATDLDKQKALLAVDKAQEKLDKTMAGTSDTAEQQASALQAVQDAQEALAKASQPVSQKDIQQDYVKTQQTIDDTASKYGDYVVGQVEGTGRVLTELEKLQIHRDAEIVSLDKQRQTVAKGSPLYQAVSADLDRHHSIPTSIGSDITVSGNAAGTIVGPKATGGPVSAMKTYRVNERGEEYFTPTSAGTIIPAGKWGGSGGGSVTNFYFTVNVDPAADRASVGRALEECRAAWLRAGGQPAAA